MRVSEKTATPGPRTKVGGFIPARGFERSVIYLGAGLCLMGFLMMTAMGHTPVEKPVQEKPERAAPVNETLPQVIPA